MFNREVNFSDKNKKNHSFNDENALLIQVNNDDSPSRIVRNGPSELGNSGERRNDNPDHRNDERDDNEIQIEDIIECSGDVDVRLCQRQTSIPLEEIQMRKFSSLPQKYKDFLALEWDKGCFMSDGKRQIDFVLVWEDEDPNVEPQRCATKSSYDSEEEEDEDPENRSTPMDRKARRRQYFEANLEKMELQLERAEISPTLGRTRFTFIHAPFHVLEKQAQLLCVKLPVRKCDVYFQNRKYLPNTVDTWLSKMHIFEFDEETRTKLDEPDYFTAPYSADRRHQFVNWDRPDIMFPSAERVRMVYDLLTRAHYGSPYRDHKDRVHYRFGIDRLMANYTYTSAFPLHQELRSRPEMQPTGPESQREMLYIYWASWRNLIKYQPLDSIKRYFGTKIALYFAWLGYYTRSLYLASFVGILCVIFGMWNVDQDIVSNDICGRDGIGAKTIICPYCEDYCDFQRLNSSCAYAKISYLFDNGMTVIFAALMSVWATMFLEGWKRYHSEIAWKWGLMDFVVEEELVRPDFQFRVKTRRYNPVTQQDEPFLSGKKKAANWIASSATVLFFIVLVLATVFGMVVYRVIMMKLLAQANDPKVDSWAFLIVTITAAIINLIVILIMNYIYYELALCLTRWECPRTQSDFDNSFTFKVFLFQFVNYYASLFYIAFFKGLFSQIPGARDNDGNVKIAGHRLEGCDPAGCFVELVVQLATIMCGRQFFNSAIELAYPYIMTLFRKWQWQVPILETKNQRKIRIQNETHMRASGKMRRCEEDYYLAPSYDQFLFDEYLEMVIQFGFVTLFVSAFPLAPFFALVNNILEIRLDAYKFLVTQQRPVPEQAKNIGVWNNILDFLSKASVTINALVIAFTSDFIPKTLYYYANGGMDGYVESSLSWFDARHLHIKNESGFAGITACRYRGYREPPCSLNFTNPKTGTPVR
ncbi:hypothetical protein WR25_15161 isoform C [Diploscapter pachys]|uniref:Anoctamin n=1 Tax=Diploscapter pachys TaxID=2018661 RepID=A0A2A2KP25_9BILA|nr:hypothetical protein WR25_15161 isoform B [Diploscapter pachys]PAV75660.1 hypothetical protein WR25_15161 isoform C [Diploscapter pachys]